MLATRALTALCVMRDYILRYSESGRRFLLSIRRVAIFNRLLPQARGTEHLLGS